MGNKGNTERFKGWILGILNGIDPQMLVDMIKDNEMPVLWEYELPSYLGFVGSLVLEYKDSILEQLSFDNVMNYAKEYRPDLARILTHPAAEKWMTRFLRMISFMVENADLDAYQMAAKFKRKTDKILEKREKKQANDVALMLEQQRKEIVAQEQQKRAEIERKKKEKEIRKQERFDRKLLKQELYEKKILEKEQKSKESLPQEHEVKTILESEPIEQPIEISETDEAEPSDIYKAMGIDGSSKDYDFV